MTSDLPAARRCEQVHARHESIKYGGVSRKSNIYALERVPIFHTEKTNRDFIERIHYTPQFESFGWTKH